MHIMNELNQFAELLRWHITVADETPETVDLHLTREEFMAKMLLEKDGQAYLDLMEMGEWRVCERMGLTNAYVKEGVAYIDVPRWKNLVAHLRIVNSV